MRLGYFTMPLHPMERSPTETLQEDREAIILADQLGFYDAFVGEHLTEKTENITSSMMFLATLISRYEERSSSDRHLQPVADAPGADRLRTPRCSTTSREGRFIFGISAGALRVRRGGARQPGRRTATRCSPRRSTSSSRSGSAKRRTTSIFRATATRCRWRGPAISNTAEATSTSRSRSRAPRSWARWWRRSRKA